MVVITPPRHLIEWYRAELTGTAVAEMVAALDTACDDGDVRILVTMAVPADEVFYVVFAASSSEKVVDMCRRAGLPPQRVTADVDARIHPGA